MDIPPLNLENVPPQAQARTGILYGLLKGFLIQRQCPFQNVAELRQEFLSTDTLLAMVWQEPSPTSEDHISVIGPALTTDPTLIRWHIKPNGEVLCLGPAENLDEATRETIRLHLHMNSTLRGTAN